MLDLVARLEKARNDYYNGNPTMSDAQYDALEDELRKQNPNHPFLAKVGSPVPQNGAWAKTKHAIPMGSLNKAQVDTEISDWLKGCSYKAGEALTITDKCDGISLALHYRDRKMVQAVTRGDGLVGEDITRNVLLMKGFPKVLPPTLFAESGPFQTPNDVYIRGEIIVTHTDFDTFFKGESNPRNTASGTAKRQSDAAKCAHLTVLCYQLLPNGVTYGKKQEELKALQTAGFQTPQVKVCHSVAEVFDRYENYVAKDRKALDYDIDGLVIDIDSTPERDRLGDLNGRPKGSIAFKFPHESKATVLRAIRWQVGNSGRITPVAEFDTVSLAGANVSQASLHNISNIDALVAMIGQQFFASGDKIRVSRRNDVIPYVEEALEAYQGADVDSKVLKTPTNCPACAGKLERDGEYLVCRNEECSAQATGALRRWVKKIGVLHVGDSLLEAMAAAFPFILTEAEFESRFGVKQKDFTTLPADRQEVIAASVMDPADLYCLDVDAVAALDTGGRRVGGTADKAIGNLMAKMTMPLQVVVGSIGIPLIGRDMTKTIIDAGYNSLSLMLKARVTSPLHLPDRILPGLASIPGVGDTKAKAFVEGFEAKVGLLAKLNAVGVRVQTVKGPLVGKSFCLTGFRDAALTDALELAGGTVKSSVSKGLDFLIAADPNSNTGKAQTARKLGTKVIGVDEARTMAGL